MRKISTSGNAEILISGVRDMLTFMEHPLNASINRHIKRITTVRRHVNVKLLDILAER